MGEELARWRRAVRPSATDLVSGALGCAMVGLSWLARNEAEPYSLLALASGVALLGLTLLPLRRAKVGPVDLEMEERRTSTTVAAELDEGVLEGRQPASDGGSDVIGALNYLAGNLALRAVIERAQAEGPLAGTDLRLYLYDEAVGRLVPTVATVEAVTQWPPGVGAAGVAYASGAFVLAAGDAVHDPTYGLSEEMASRYEGLASVAAMPVFNAGEEVLGVVTASTTDASVDLGRTDAYDALNLVALLAGRVLVDLLRWFDDP